MAALATFNTALSTFYCSTPLLPPRYSTAHNICMERNLPEHAGRVMNERHVWRQDAERRPMGGGTGRTGAYLTTRMTTHVSLSRVEKANSAFAKSCGRIWRATTKPTPNALPTGPPTGVVEGSRAGGSRPGVVAWSHRLPPALRR
eukprot:COSAG05_NODE_151_length_15993_cov_1413.204039_4_plen_145_part_00